MLSFPSVRVFRKLIFAFLYLALSFYDISVIMTYSGWGMQRTIYGSAALAPTAYRALVPAISRGLYNLIPRSIEEAIKPTLIDFRESEYGKYIMRASGDKPPPLSDDTIVEAFVNMFVVYLTLLALIYIIFLFGRDLFPDSYAYALISPLIAMLLVPPFGSLHYVYTYDFAEAFFSCACVYLLFKQRWGAYLFCLAIGTINKETTMFAIFFYFVWFWNKRPLKQYLKFGVAQIFIYALVKASITYYFSANGGRGHYIGDAIVNIVHLAEYNYSTLLGLVLTTFLITFQWQEKPTFLRATLWVALANWVAYILMCTPGEYRSFYSSMPFLSILAAHTMVDAAGIARHPAFARVHRQKKV
jgi:hypothetical protein